MNNAYRGGTLATAGRPREGGAQRQHRPDAWDHDGHTAAPTWAPVGALWLTVARCDADPGRLRHQNLTF